MKEILLCQYFTVWKNYFEKNIAREKYYYFFHRVRCPTEYNIELDKRIEIITFKRDRLLKIIIQRPLYRNLYALIDLIFTRIIHSD